MNQSPMILGIETSTRAGGVALVDGDGVVVSLHVNIAQSHSRQTAGLVSQALEAVGIKANELTGVGCSIGPGSFTGVRIGLAVAKGLCMGADLPLIGISTLEAMAARMETPGALIAPMLDARRGEAYAALFRSRGAGATPERLSDDTRLDANKWLRDLKDLCALIGTDEPIHFSGDGQGKFRKNIESALGERARFLGPLTGVASAEAVALLTRLRLEAAPSTGANWDTLEPEYVS